MSQSPSASKLEQLQGLASAKKAVERILDKKSDVHAVLFYGPEGAGKTTLAQVLAKSWLCPNKQESGLSCDACPVCAAFDVGRAVDYQEFGPWGPSSLIKTSAFRPVPEWEKDKERPPIIFVLEYFRTRPMMAANKVVLIKDAHRMNSEAANTFLKTLEEPAKNSKIVMTTSEFSRVLPTVRSRCMCLACELPERSNVALAGGYFSPVESVFGGSPGGAAHVLEHKECFQNLFDLLESCLASPLAQAPQVAERARAVAEQYAKSADCGARHANVKIVESISAWLAERFPERYEVLAKSAECHRLLLGNAQAGPVFEVLFFTLLYHIGERTLAHSR